MTSFVNADQGVGFVIHDIYAYLCVHDDGDEGVVGVRMADGTWLPLIAADSTRLEALRGMAEKVVREAGKPVRLVRFWQREELELIEPPGG